MLSKPEAGHVPEHRCPCLVCAHFDRIRSHGWRRRKTCSRFAR
jgi:hypothetical protein